MSGLTALDLAVTLSIIALLVAGAVPALKQVVMHQRMKAAVAALHSDLVLARNVAIQRNAYVILCPSGPGNSCTDNGTWQNGWLVFIDLDGDREWDPAQERVLRLAAARPHLSILGSSYRTRLRLYPNGTAPGSNARLTFCDDRGADSARSLVLSASGRVRLDDTVNGAALACPGFAAG